ncbi:transposase [Streptomyces sp. NPDC016309]|uniref:transposase n=1 Tax=Streptomyces sp. NPDC016309 TaxID=3364965 RepID=UPI0036F5DA61
MRAGAPWRDLPTEYGPWQTVLWAFPPLAARWCLIGDVDRAAGPGGRGRADHPGGRRRLDGLPGSSARGRCAAGRPSPEGTAGRQPGRTRRPWAGPAPRWLDHRDSPGVRTRAKAVIAADQSRSAGRQAPQFTAVLEAIRVSPPRTGPAPRSPAAGAGRLGPVGKGLVIASLMAATGAVAA